MCEKNLELREFEVIDLADLRAGDLHGLADCQIHDGRPARCYRAWVYEDGQRQPEPVEVVHLPYVQRVGIAWGGAGQWGDIKRSEELEDVLDEWLQGAESWEARN